MSKKPKKQSVYNFTVSDPQKAVALINLWHGNRHFCYHCFASRNNVWICLGHWYRFMYKRQKR